LKKEKNKINQDHCGQMVCGMHYKHIVIVSDAFTINFINDNFMSVIDHSRVTIQIVASLNGNPWGIIYGCNMFIIQAIDVILLVETSWIVHYGLTFSRLFSIIITVGVPILRMNNTFCYISQLWFRYAYCL